MSMSAQGYNFFHFGPVDELGQYLDTDDISSIKIVDTDTNTDSTIYEDGQGDSSKTNPVTSFDGATGVSWWSTETSHEVVVTLKNGDGIRKTIKPGVNNVVVDGVTQKSVWDDPGDGNDLPVGGPRATIGLVTTGAETRTLDDPLTIGQELTLSFKTDGGNCVVTTNNAMNQTGNNTLTFADAGDMIRLVAVEVGSNLRWREVANDGVALTTV